MKNTILKYILGIGAIGTFIVALSLILNYIQGTIEWRENLTSFNLIKQNFQIQQVKINTVTDSIISTSEHILR